MLLYVNRADKCPERDVEIDFENKSGAGNFNIMRLKPGNYLLVTKLPFSCSFYAASEEFAYSQEQSIVYHHGKHWSDSIYEIGSSVACLFEDR